MLCGLAGVVPLALRGGPVDLRLPGGMELRAGSESFVLSSYSFQNGTTYFVDLNRSGARNILQLHYLADTRSVEVVLHHATQNEQSDSRLWSMPLP